MILSKGFYVNYIHFDFVGWKLQVRFDITTCPFEVNKQIMQLHYLFHYRIASEQVSQIKLMYLETFNYCLTSDHSPGFKWLSFMIHKLELKVRLFRKDFLVSSNYPKKTNKRICLSSKNEFVCSFLGEFEDTKNSFRNYLTFRAWILYNPSVSMATGTI